MSPPPSALEIARALIRFPSATPTDAGALPYLRDLSGKARFATDLVPSEAPGPPPAPTLTPPRPHPARTDVRRWRGRHAQARQARLAQRTARRQREAGSLGFPADR